MDLPKVNIAVIGVICSSLGGMVWYASEQASIIANLQETVAVLTAENSATERVNLQRDVQQNEKEINDIWEDSDDLWNEIAALAVSINAINELKQRIALLENELKYVNRDHNMMMKSGE